MSHTLVVTQPNYLPWLGYFEQLARADTVVFLDTVARSKNHWDNRNRLRTREGETFWLSLPLRSTGLSTPIADIELAPDVARWRRKHHRAIRQALGPAKHWPDVEPMVEAIEAIEADHLADLNIAIIEVLARGLGIDTPVHRASDLDPTGDRVERLIGLCRRFGASTYYTSAAAAAYLEEERAPFDETGIAIEYQDFRHPTHPQVGSGFVSHLSVLDTVANVGAAAVGTMIGVAEPVATVAAIEAAA